MRNTPTVAELVDEGCKLDAEIKVRTKRLEEIKADLKKVASSTGQNVLMGTNCVATITEKVNETIDPSSAYARLKALGFGKAFVECVKVNKKDIVKYLTTEELAKCSIQGKPTIAIAFSK